MKSICRDKERVNLWVSERVGRKDPWSGRGYQAIGIEDDGELVGGAVIDGIVTGARCSIHCAGEGKHWLNREFLHAVFDYVFNVCRCKVAINPVSGNNGASLRFTEHVGYTHSVTIPDGDGDSDLFIFTMHRDQCRWLGD